MAGLGLKGPLALDSNCLIYLLEQPGTTRHQQVASAIREAGEYGIVVSTLAITELLTGALRHGGADTAAILSTVIQEFPNADIVPLDLEIATRTARARIETGLRLPDAVIVATALVARADVLLTNDRQVSKLTVSNLRIVHLEDVAT